MYLGGFQIGVILLVAIIGLPIFFALMFDLKFGVITVLIFAFILSGAKRFITQILKVDVPLGVMMDLMIAAMLFGLFIQQIRKTDWSFLKNPLTYFVFAWMLYNILQVANPSAASREAWLYTVRGFAGIMVMYFIFLYVIDNLKIFNSILFVWIFLGLLGAFWGFSQEHFGFMSWEYQSIYDEDRIGLYFIDGKWRVFSFFSDPMIFGIFMSYTGLLCLMLLGGPFSTKFKVVLASIGLFMFVVMLYSGTRAAYVLPFASIVFFALLNFNAKVFTMGIVGIIVGLVLINIPTSDPNLLRFQTAFKPGDDASYQLREQNQAYIKPFIQSHPLGGGLGSTGVWGERFSPNTMLAKFPPDSGYVRIAVEAGWIGLLIYLSMLFMAFKVGVEKYRVIKDKKIKSYLGALMCALFALTVANFPQEAIGQYPTNLLFFLILAFICNASKIEANLTGGEKDVKAT